MSAQLLLIIHTDVRYQTQERLFDQEIQKFQK